MKCLGLAVPWLRFCADRMLSLYQGFLNLCLLIYFDSVEDYDGDEKVLFHCMFDW